MDDLSVEIGRTRESAKVRQGWGEVRWYAGGRGKLS